MENVLFYIKPYEALEFESDPSMPRKVVDWAGCCISDEITCKVSGFPRPHYQWYHGLPPGVNITNYKALEESRDHITEWKLLPQQTSHQLHLPELKCSDCGWYRCEVWQVEPISEETIADSLLGCPYLLIVQPNNTT